MAMRPRNIPGLAFLVIEPSQLMHFTEEWHRLSNWLVNRFI